MSLPRAPLFLSALLFAACAPGVKADRPSPSQGALARRYQEGDVLKYQFSGTHYEKGTLDSTWAAQAVSTAVKDSSGVFHEEFQWTRLKEDGKDVEPPPEVADFRQKLSLDPRFPNRIPDLSKLAQYLGSQITDTLTFYSGYWLAAKKGLAKAGDHAYVKFGQPSSWADGRRVVAGYDCVDFDVTLTGLDDAARLATLKVKFVPPPQGCEKYPVEWMRRPVFDTANNWLEVTKGADGAYDAAVGKEVFEADLKILLPSGVIKSATLDNPVLFEKRACKDAGLSDCGKPERLDLVRKINFTLDQQ